MLVFTLLPLNNADPSFGQLKHLQTITAEACTIRMIHIRVSLSLSVKTTYLASLGTRSSHQVHSLPPAHDFPI